MSTTYDSVFLCSPFERPGWTAAPEYREGAIKSFGFTERQARFLVVVMLHGGVCVERQYCTFAGIAHGQKAHDFFRRLMDRGYATSATPGAVHRGRFYHVHHKALYRAIGEPDNRNRKPLSYPAAVERLMLLDAVLAEPQLTWLGSAHDKCRTSAIVSLSCHRKNFRISVSASRKSFASSRTSCPSAFIGTAGPRSSCTW